jgi:hypothetical protein
MEESTKQYSKWKINVYRYFLIKVRMFNYFFLGGKICAARAPFVRRLNGSWGFFCSKQKRRYLRISYLSYVSCATSAL